MKSFPNTTTILKTEDQHTITTHIEPETVIPLCQHCHSPKVVKKGREKVIYRDTPLNGKQSLIECTRKRFQCNGCGRSTPEEFSWASNVLPITREFEQHIINRAYSCTTAELLAESGLTRIQINQILKHGLAQVDFRHEWVPGRVMQMCRFSIKSETYLGLVNPELSTLLDITHRPTPERIKAVFDRVDSRPIEVFIAPVDPEVIKIAESQKNIKRVVITTDVYANHINQYLVTLLSRTIKPLRTERGKTLFTTPHHKLSDAQCTDIYALFKQSASFERLYAVKELLVNAMGSPSNERIEALTSWYEETEPSLKDVLLPLYKALQYCIPYIDDESAPETPPIPPLVSTLSGLIKSEIETMTFPVIRARLLHDKSCLVHDKSALNSRPQTKARLYLKNDEKERKLLGTDVNKLTLRTTARTQAKCA